MNKRIKELAEQAGATVITTHGMEDVVDGCYVIGHTRLEKFAELIVRECLTQNKLAIQSLKDNPEDIPGFKTIMNLAQVTCRNQIEDHFGVEE